MESQPQNPETEIILKTFTHAYTKPERFNFRALTLFMEFPICVSANKMSSKAIENSN